MNLPGAQERTDRLPEPPQAPSAPVMRRGFTLIELMVVIAIIATVAAIAIPGLLAAQRASNERNASASLKTLLTAEADFRSNDRDGNLVPDFWTGDVFGLYGLVPLTGPTLSGDTADASGILQLIDVSIAAADADSDLDGYDNVLVDASIGTGSPKAGYLYRSFSDMQGVGGATTLGNDTDGAAGYPDIHDIGRYAFMAAPISLSSGGHLFIVSADHTVWKYKLPATYSVTYQPLTAAGDAVSVIAGTGQAMLDDADIYPFAPGSIGCAKLD